MLKIGFRALSWAFFGPFSSNFIYELILARSGLGIKMNKFCQISTELLPFMKIGFGALS